MIRCWKTQGDLLCLALAIFLLATRLPKCHHPVYHS